MRYEIPFVWYTASAKNKGIIPYSSQADADWIVVDAVDDDAAYVAVVKRVASLRDKRPVSGRSYVRRWRAADVTLNNGRAPCDMLPTFKVGDRVVLHAPHACGHSEDGKGYRHGVIDEVLSSTHYGIRLDGYPNVADFTLREFASEG